LRFLWLF